MGITTKADIALIALKANTASLALTASYFSGSVTNAISASYADTASYFSGSISNAISASYALTASYFSGSISNAISASYALSASTTLAASVTQNPDSAGAYPLVFVTTSDRIANLNTDSASLSYNPAANTLTATSSRAVSASKADNATYSNTVGIAPDTTTNTFYPIPFASTAFGNAELYSDSSIINFNPSTNRLFITSISSSNITGSSFTGSFTGSLFGTSSWANNVISASFAATASFFSGSISNAISASFAITSGLAQRIEVVDLSGAAGAYEILFVDSSGSQIAYAELNNFYYVPASDTLYVDNIIVSQSLTARGVSLTGSFSGSLVGTASWASNVISASFASTASFVATASWANNVVSASFASTASYVLNAVSSSFASTASFVATASWAQSASNAVTSSVAASAVTVAITNTTSSGGGPFYPMFTSTNSGNGSALVDSNIFLYAPTTNTLTVTASYATQAISASYSDTASYLNPGTYTITASWAQSSSQAISASRAISSSFATSASWAPDTTFPYTGSAFITGSLTVTGSIIATSFTGSLLGTSSWANNVISASFASTASYVLNAVSASFASTASFVATSSWAQSASQAVSASRAISSSFALTSSYVNTLRQDVTISGSLFVSSSILGSGSFYNTTIDLQSAAIKVNNTESIAYGVKYLFDDKSVRSVLWNARQLLDNSQSLSINWDNRTLNSGSTTVLNWSSGTGSLIGTSSWAQSASNTINAQTASFLPIGTYNITASWAVSASQALTSSRATSASYALSASWAPGGSSTPTFPYTGSAIISGSLVITGSLQVGVPGVNNPRINTVVGTLSRGDVVSVDWISKQLQDASTISSLDWESRVLYDTAGGTSIDWENRTLSEGTGTYVALEYSSNTYVNSQLYYRNVIPDQVQRAVADTPAYGGQVIQATVAVGVADYSLVYLETDGTWYNPKATVGYGPDKMLGVCVDQAGGYVLIEGDIGVSDDNSQGVYISGADHGLPVYISDTTGRMTITAPSSTNNVVRIVGHIYYQSTTDANWWTMKFRPSNDWYVI
jgi:hypothetical protein